MPDGFDDWTEEQLLHIRNVLSEFLVNHKSAKSKKEVYTGTIKGHIAGLQRAFSRIWKYKDINLWKGPIFAYPDKGLTVVMDNLFAKQQAGGAVVKSHNILARSDVTKLYQSPSLSRDTPKSFQARLVFNICLSCALCTTELYKLKIDQFHHDVVDGQKVWKVRGVIGETDGASKTVRGGIKTLAESQRRPQFGMQCLSMALILTPIYLTVCV